MWTSSVQLGVTGGVRRYRQRLYIRLRRGDAAGGRLYMRGFRPFSYDCMFLWDGVGLGEEGEEELSECVFGFEAYGFLDGLSVFEE